MAELPKTRSGLTRLAKSAQASRRRRRMESMERTEKMWEAGGALVLVPVMKQLTVNLPFVGTFLGELDEKMQVAAVSYGLSLFVSGKAHDALWGATLGAMGAAAWEGEGLIAGLFQPEGG